MFAARLHDPANHAAVKRIADLDDVAILEPTAIDKEPVGCNWSDSQFWHFSLGPPAAADNFDYRPWLVVAFFTKSSTTMKSPPMPILETIAELAPRLKRKEISPVELTQACLDRIEKLNPSLNAFITVTADSAMADARAAEIEIAHGQWRGPLHGIPIALKDLIDTAGTRTTA